MAVMCRFIMIFKRRVWLNTAQLFSRAFFVHDPTADDVLLQL